MPQPLRTTISAREAHPATATKPAPSKTAARHPIDRLQHSLGNRRVGQLIQAKRLTPDGATPAPAARPAAGAGGGAAPSSTVPAPTAASPALPAVDAVSGAGGPAPLPAGGGRAGRPLPPAITLLSTVTAAQAPGMVGVAAVGASLLGNQLNVDAFDKALKGPVPTGLPTGREPALPPDPSIPDAEPAADAEADSPAALEAAARGGAAQLEASRRAAEPVNGDLSAGALAPTEPPAQMPPLALSMVYPAGLPEPIAASADPQVAQVLEHGFGAPGRATASRELAGGQALLAHHEDAVEAQHTEAAEQLRAENERATAEQVAVRELARLGVQQDQARLRTENAEAIDAYRRAAASERATAETEVQQAKEDARKAAEAAQHEEEDDDPAWYERAWSAVKSGASAVAGAVKGAVVKAYRFVKERVTRFFSKLRELVSAGIAALREIGGRIYRGIRDRIRAGLNKINEIARRIGSFVAGLVRRAGAFLSDLVGRVVDGFRRLVGAIADFWRKAWALAGKVKEFIAMMANGAIDVVVELIENPKAVLQKAKGAIQGLVNRTPGKIGEVYAEHLAPLLDAQAAPAPERSGAVLQRSPVQRQEAEAEVAPESHSAGVWRHLKVRGAYFLEHWWEVLLDAALEILVPGVALYRHLPGLWKAMKEGWNALWAGEWSKAVDAGLTAGREAMAIFSTFIAQVSIAAFIIGSVLGTPVVGAAALETIGLITIAVDASLQIATIAKSASNLGRADENEERLETDYGRVADSSIALAVMLALVLLGAIASKTASALVRRFPALGRAAEALKQKLQRGVGLKPKSPGKIVSKLKPLEPVPPQADLPIRKDLLPHEQLAFDKWVAERRASGVDVDKALKGKTLDQVRRMLRSQLEWVAEQEARKMHNAQWEGEMLDPQMTNPPTQQGGADVWARWNDKPPAEIGEGVRLNAKTGERIDLFGDDFPGIDGTIGRPPRPLQLKAVPASEDIANIPRVAGTALEKARTHGFSRVEVSIEAPGRTVAQVREAFAKNPTAFTDGSGVTRVRVWCDDGVFEPTSFKPVIPPPHVDPDPNRDKVPAGAAAGG